MGKQMYKKLINDDRQGKFIITNYQGIPINKRFTDINDKENTL
jgi:hypothetical protein